MKRISAARVRPLVHTVHLATAMVLFATGLLLSSPSLRAQVTGGHSLEIRDTHRWVGVAFGALPVAIVGIAGARTVFAPPQVPVVRGAWKRVNLALAIATTVLFVVTGVAMWQMRRLPDGVVDAARNAHGWLTWMFALLVAAHVAEVATAAAQRRFGCTARR